MCFSHFGASPRGWLPARLVLCFSLLWTLAPRDYVTYCQARGLSGHTSPHGECVCFNLEDSAPPEVKKTISLSRGRTLSGHTWSTARKFSILNLSSLHPYGKPNLGYATRRRFTLLDDGSHCSAMVHTAQRCFTLLDDGSQLLGNSSRWSNHEFDCSVLFASARTSSRRRCTTGTRRSRTSCGGYDPRYPWQTTWAAPPGVI